MELYKEDCYKSDWIYSSSVVWTITPDDYSLSANPIFHINGKGGLTNNGALATENIYPVIYLKSDKLCYDKFLNFTILPNSQPDKEYGSLDNPFILSLN